jgi:hypothetical protein
MNETKHGHHMHGGSEGEGVDHGHRPYWKRAHRDWRFWGVVLLMLAAMVIYVMSENLAWRPRSQPQQSLSGAGGK